MAHAIAVSLPTAERPMQHLILTARPELYPPGIVTVGIDDPRLEPWAALAQRWGAWGVRSVALCGLG
ncbi:hypothetical protein [Kitasatospora cineracea]|uniref:hypothetical protein n=2 Tax=Kitasatospora cineracea TaxID=88074 RepID=UPI0033F85413